MCGGKMLTRNTNITPYERLLGYGPSASFVIDPSISGTLDFLHSSHEGGNFCDLEEADVWQCQISANNKGVSNLFDEQTLGDDRDATGLKEPAYDSKAARNMCTAVEVPSTCDNDHVNGIFVSSYGQRSSPINVPYGPLVTEKEERLADAADDEEMLLPHELLAKHYARSDLTNCSVMEGAGRTLKGRDASKVRDGVWKDTGFCG